MRLSEAIRLGGVSVKQYFGNYVDPETFDSFCAMGAAYHSLGLWDEKLKTWKRDYLDKKQLGEWSRHRLPLGFRCAKCDTRFCAFCALPTYVIHLNDIHKCSFTEIADIIEEVEDRYNFVSKADKTDSQNSLLAQYSDHHHSAPQNPSSPQPLPDTVEEEAASLVLVAQ